MPDALSKTIPIWTTVLNRMLFPNDFECQTLQTPEDVVSRSEHAQIEGRLPTFVSELLQLGLDTDDLRTKLGEQSLKVVWVTPATPLLIPPSKSSDRNLIVLCTASGRTNSQSADPDYVQGAADDSESWAHGLKPETFWMNSLELLETSEDDLPAVMHELRNVSEQAYPLLQPVLIESTTNLYIGNNAAAESQYSDFDIIISCSEDRNETIATKLKARFVHLRCTTGKVGSRQLRSELLKLDFISKDRLTHSKVLVTCHSGKDLAVGVALAVICLCYSGDGTLKLAKSHSDRSIGVLNKAIIKHRLSWIMVSMPDAAPSRATLQSVNAFLLG